MRDWINGTITVGQLIAGESRETMVKEPIIPLQQKHEIEFVKMDHEAKSIFKRKAPKFMNAKEFLEVKTAVELKDIPVFLDQIHSMGYPEFKIVP